PSFPMTHVIDMPQILDQIDMFRETLAEHFITFDPSDMDEKRLLYLARSAMEKGKDTIVVKIHDRQLEFSVHQINAVADDIDGQIYARDFKLIDQSDMIVSYIPELAGGKPSLSSGVERELQHAFEATKEVYVIWKPKDEPSPFITETANKVFNSLEQAMQYFQENRYLQDYQLRLDNVEHP
ncbi:MAG: hypothetical protein JSV03_06230, partial [Planctomycetota bacterium]